MKAIELYEILAKLSDHQLKEMTICCAPDDSDSYIDNAYTATGAMSVGHHTGRNENCIYIY